MTETNQQRSPEADPVHDQILKSTSIIGGSSAMNVVFGIVRAKVAAVLVGTTGMGTLGLFQSATGIAQMLSGMGLATSAVRSIADAHASGDEQRTGRTIVAMRRAVLFFGLVCSMLFFLFRRQISVATFGDEDHAGAMGWLALVPLLLAVAGGQSALIRGMRRIGDLARVSVLGALLGTVLGLPVLFFWREQGLAPYLVVIAACTIVVSWWYARKIRVRRVPLGLEATAAEAWSMVSLGAVLMLAGLVTLAAGYLAKVMVARELGLGATGLFEASSQLSNVYVGFILGAMAADFFPHLSSVSRDDALSAKLINAQAEVGLLLAAPGILAVIALGPYLLRLLYSAEFVDAFDILRWQALGTFLRVVSWPIGFLFLARGKRGYFFLSEVVVNGVYLSLLVIGLRYLGLRGVGLAFFGMYLFYALFMTALARRLIGYRWAAANLRLVFGTVPVVALALAATYLLPSVWAAATGLALAAVAGAFSLRRLYVMVGPERFRRVTGRLRNAALFWRKRG